MENGDEDLYDAAMAYGENYGASFSPSIPIAQGAGGSFHDVDSPSPAQDARRAPPLRRPAAFVDDLGSPSPTYRGRGGGRGCGRLAATDLFAGSNGGSDSSVGRGTAPYNGTAGGSARRGGAPYRAPRPSPMVGASMPPPAGNTPHNGGPHFSEYDKADWTNPVNNTIFCKLCVEEIETGNRPNGLMTTRGYNNIALKFFEQTGKRHSRVQLKNRWDALKGLYTFWLRINKDTGLGWCPTKQTVVASEEFWRVNTKEEENEAEEEDEAIIAARNQINLMQQYGAMSCIVVVVPTNKVVQHVGRHGYPTQNVLAICDFDIRFTFAVAGWPGSVHDMRVFNDAIRKYADKFPFPPDEKYYLVDSGYPNQKGYLAPYKGTKYHLLEFRLGPGPSGKKEVFNQLHSSLRNVIERAFGVLKMKWRILLDLPSYPMLKQSKIIHACMCLHNFIRDSALPDQDFDMCDQDENYVPIESSQQSSGTSQHGQEEERMNVFRDNLATALYAMRE